MGLKNRFKDFAGITKIVTSYWLDASGVQQVSE
jgi:hypothetical protein